MRWFWFSGLGSVSLGWLLKISGKRELKFECWFCIFSSEPDLNSLLLLLLSQPLPLFEYLSTKSVCFLMHGLWQCWVHLVAENMRGEKSYEVFHYNFHYFYHNPWSSLDSWLLLFVLVFQYPYFMRKCRKKYKILSFNLISSISTLLLPTTALPPAIIASCSCLNCCTGVENPEKEMERNTFILNLHNLGAKEGEDLFSLNLMCLFGLALFLDL